MPCFARARPTCHVARDAVRNQCLSHVARSKLLAALAARVASFHACVYSQFNLLIIRSHCVRVCLSSVCCSRQIATDRRDLWRHCLMPFNFSHRDSQHLRWLPSVVRPLTRRSCFRPEKHNTTLCPLSRFPFANDSSQRCERRPVALRSRMSRACKTI